jgi:hypothetical protein
MAAMPAGLAFALAAAAQTVAAAPPSAFGPAATAATAPEGARSKQAQSECKTPAVPDPNSREIIVCAVKPNGYRLDPDVVTANRLKKKGESVRPRNPHESYADHSCATVGPMGCRGQPTIDIFTAAAALATMAERLSEGQEIGSMFETTPAKGDYALYLEAKKQREETEADKAAKSKAAAAQAAADRAKTQH